MSDTIAGKTVLVTGANRGLGQALVQEALERRAMRVYAASRRPMTAEDERVTPLTLDVTDETQIRGASRSGRVARPPDQQRRRVEPRRPERAPCHRAAPWP